MVLSSAVGSTMTGIDLHPCFIICSIVLKEVCPSDVVYVKSLPSWLESGVLKVMWLIWFVSGVKFLGLCVEGEASVWLDASGGCRFRSPAGTGFPQLACVITDYVQ